MSADRKADALVPCDGHWEISGSKEFHRQRHGDLLLGELLSLHKDSILTDVVLKASCGSEFPCHRVLLAASSPYFRAMFTSGMAEKNAEEINLPEISEPSLASLVNYIYTGKIAISSDNAQDLAEASGFLQFMDVQQVCFKFLEAQLNVSNTLEVEHVGDRLFSRQLSEHARHFSADHFVEVASSPEFYDYTKEEIIDLLTRELQIDCEEQVYEAIMRWVRKDVQERIAALPELLAKVAFEVMPTSYLADILGKETLLEDNPECAGMIAKIRMVAMKREMQGEQPRSRVLNHVRNYTEVVIVFRNNVASPTSTAASDSATDSPALKSTILQYNPSLQKWEDLPPIPLKLMYEFPNSATTLQNNVIVITSNFRTWLYKSHDKAWSLLAQKFPSRHGSCLVSTATDVYLIGGASDVKAAPVKSVLKYDSYVQQWKENGEMPIQLTHVTGVCCHGNIYAIGSKTGSHFTTEMLRYNPNNQSWKRCPSIPIKLMRVEAVAISGNIYVVGQQNDFSLEVCKFDTSTNIWEQLEGPLIPRMGAATIVCNNKIFLIGGKSLKGDFMEQEENTVETFDPQDGVWSIHGDMPVLVCGFPAVTILHPNHSPSRFLGPKQHLTPESDL